MPSAGSTWSPRRAATPSASPTTATPGRWRPRTSRCGSARAPTARRRSTACSTSPGAQRRDRQALSGRASAGTRRRCRATARGSSPTCCRPRSPPSARPGWHNVLGLPPTDVVRGVPGRRARLAAAPRPRRRGALPRRPGSRRRRSPRGVPSTTATSLTSLGTGLPPGSHGVVGFTSRIPGTDRLLDALRWDKHVDPREWQTPRHGRSRGRAQSGVDGDGREQADVRGHRADRGQPARRDVRRRRHRRRADLRRCPVSHRDAESLTYVYEGELDATGHRQRLRVVGVGAPARPCRLRSRSGCARRCPSAPRWSSPADHGMVDVDAGPSHRRRRGARADATGSACSAARPASATSTATTAPSTTWPTRWAERLGDDGRSCSPATTRSTSGWFGEVASEVRPRLGDVMVASLGDRAVVSTSRFPHEATLVGLHGSLTDGRDAGPAPRRRLSLTAAPRARRRPSHRTVRARR